MTSSSFVTRIAWTTAIGLAMSQALVEYWKKIFVGPDKAVIHGLAMLALVAMFQLGIVFAPLCFKRAAKWRTLAAGLMAPTLLSLGYLIIWHVTKWPTLIEGLPIPATVWATQLMVLPLAMLGYLAVLVRLGWPSQTRIPTGNSPVNRAGRLLGL